MSRVYLAGPNPEGAFINGIYARAAVRLEQAGHEVINPTTFTYFGSPHFPGNWNVRFAVSQLATHASVVCTLHGADPRIIKTAALLDIPVKTLEQLTRKDHK